jgi:ABC-type multidrug transport system ATPase subunit
MHEQLNNPVGSRGESLSNQLGVVTFRDSMRNFSSMILPGYFLLSELDGTDKRNLYYSWVYNIFSLFSKRCAYQIAISSLRDISSRNIFRLLCKLPSILSIIFSREDAINYLFSIQNIESSLIKKITRKVMRSMRVSPVDYRSDVARAIYCLPSDIKQVLSGQFKNSSADFMLNIARVLYENHFSGLVVLSIQAIKIPFLRPSVPNQGEVSSYNQDVTDNIRRGLEYNHLGGRESYQQRRVESAGVSLASQGSNFNNQLIVRSSMESVAVAIVAIIRCKILGLDAAEMERQLASELVGSLHGSISLSQLTMCGEWINCAIRRIKALLFFIEKNQVVCSSSDPSFTGGEVLRLERLSHGNSPECALLNGLSAVFQPGIYRLRGENGAGKTTLFQIISGEVPPKQGSVLIGGIESSALSPRQRNYCITSIHAKPFLIMNRSLLFNLLYFLGPSVFSDELMDQAYEFEAFADLYTKRSKWLIINDCKSVVDYFLGENHDLWSRDKIEGLSAGEQKLIILMSLLLRVNHIADTKIILLDEIEANLSAAHLRRARAYLNQRMIAYRNKVIIFVAHGDRALFSNDIFRDVTVKDIRLHQGRLEWSDEVRGASARRSQIETSVLVDGRPRLENNGSRRRKLLRATL